MSKIRWSMFAHPWDLIDEGIQSSVEYLSEIGINTINVATSYHTGRYVLPHNQKHRIYTAEEGVVYFNSNDKYFLTSKLKPIKTKKYGNYDILSELTEIGRNSSIDVSAWLILLHNRVLAMKYPELAIVDPFGNRDANYLCPNREENRNYMSSLLANVVDCYKIKSVLLESPGYPTGLVHGNHHETFGVSIDPTVSYLFSMCYCDLCKKKGRENGINLDDELPIIRKLINRKINSLSKYHNNITSERHIINDLKKYGLEDIKYFKEANVKEIFTYLYEKIQGINSNVKMEAIFDYETYINEGLSLENPPKKVYGIDMNVYYSDINKIIENVGLATKLLKGMTKFFPTIRITYPMIIRNGQIEDIIKLLKQFNFAGINFYNYGWATLKNLREVSNSIKNY